MKLDDNYEIFKDSYGYTLIETTTKVAEKGNNPGEAYTHQEKWYYATVRDCLAKYCDMKIGECESVYLAINKIDVLTKLIRSIK